jgi:hypothetical protein
MSEEPEDCGAALSSGCFQHFSISAFQLLPDGFDVGVDSDNDGFAVDASFGFLVAVTAGDGERLASGGRTRRMQRDFDVEDVVFDGGFHGME